MRTAAAFLWMLAAIAWAAPDPVDAAVKPRYTAPEVFDKMLAAQEAQAWLQAAVIKQEGPINGKKAPAISRGDLQTKAGGLARMQIHTPSAGLIVADGKRLWVELTDVDQVMKYDAHKLAASGNFFLDLTSSIRHYSKASQRRLILPGEGFDASKVTALELLPLKPEQAGFERMRVWVDDQRWVVLRVLLDYGGTRSDVRFKDIHTLSKAEVLKDPSQDLDPKLFQYQAPKGFEVFDLDL